MDLAFRLHLDSQRTFLYLHSFDLWRVHCEPYFFFKSLQLFFTFFPYLNSLAGSQAGAFSYISEFHTVKTAPRAVAFASCFLSGLAIFMSLIAMAIIPLDFTWTIFSLKFKPWRLFLVCNSFINLWNGVVFAFLPESPKFLLAINEREKALQVLRRIYVFNTGLPEDVIIFDIIFDF